MAVRNSIALCIFGSIALLGGGCAAAHVSGPVAKSPKVEAQASAVPVNPLEPQPIPQSQPPPHVEATPQSKPNPDALRRTLLGVDLAFSRSCEEKGASEAFYDFMAPEGVCLLAGEL